MPQSFLHHEQDVFARFDHKQALRLQPDQCERGCEEVTARGHPQDRALQASYKAADHKRCCRTMLGVRARSGNLMECSNGQTAGW